ncbi:hypothetical protein P4110_16435 [Pseudomonas aeruginosa]|nr:hypothetical protein [Pseudomonas aeruginosa]
MASALSVSASVPSFRWWRGRRPLLEHGAEFGYRSRSDDRILGTLIGPPLIGFLSEAFGLRYAFGACVVLAIGIILRAGKIPWQAPSVV